MFKLSLNNFFFQFVYKFDFFRLNNNKNLKTISLSLDSLNRKKLSYR